MKDKLNEKIRNFLLNYSFVFNKLSADKIGAFAAQAAFFIIISFFPFIMFLTAVIQHIPIIQNSIVDISTNLLPDTIQTFLLSLIEEIFIQKSSGTFLSITVITTLWAASKAAYALMMGINVVYDVKKTKSYFLNRIIAFFYTILFEAIIVAALIFLVFGDLIMQWVITHLEVYFDIPTVLNLKTIIGFFILSAFFLIIYVIIPNKKVSIKHQMPGALIAAISWLIFSYIFSFYIENFANYTRLYGSITGIIIFMLWLYSCMYILLIGGEINVLLERYQYKFAWIGRLFFFKDKKDKKNKHKLIN